MPKAILVHATGGPEVLRYEEFDPGAPGAGQLRIRHTAIGLNFLDVYYRSGVYPPPAGLPLTLGNEGPRTFSGMIARLINEKADAKRTVEEIYLATVGRFPTETESNQGQKYVTEFGLSDGAQDLMWALINSPAFLFNR